MTLATALISCTALGLQHGVDWDHVAAISDLTNVQKTSGEAVRCGFLYATGHAATVGLLGVAMIYLRHSLPGPAALWMQRFVGLTLILLGVYVFGALFSGRQCLSRGEAVLAVFRRLRGGQPRRIAEADGGYGRKSSLGLGVLHGIGAETPTQLSMLVIATSVGGWNSGVLALTVFTTAMFISNLALTTAVTGVFTISKHKPAIFRWLGVVTAAYSLWIGIVLITGK